MSRGAVSLGRMFSRGTVAAIIGSVVLAAGAQSGAQDPQAPTRPVFRAGANFVAVDAYPTRDGRIVEDLTRDDFQVSEDGKPQQVEEFAFVRGVVGPDAEPTPTRLEAAGRLVGDPRRRVFVVYLTGYHATPEGAMNTRKATEAFFAQSVNFSDLFGVLRPNESVADLMIGERPQILTDESESYWDWASLPHPPNFPQSPAEQAEYDCLYAHQLAGSIEQLLDLWRLDRILASLEELTVRLASMREARSNILVFSGRMTFAGIRATPTSAPPMLGPGGTVAPAPMSPCDREFARLASAHLPERIESIINTAQRGDVSISVIDPAGLSIYDQSMSAQQGLLLGSVANRGSPAVRDLASSTGGVRIVGAAEIGPALLKLSAEQSGHYELGYYSSNNKFDGKFRTINVKIRKPGISVVARKGYQAPTAEMLRASQLATARAGEPEAPPSPAADAVAELGRMNPEANLYVQTARWGDRLAVTVEIASAQLDLGRWTDGASVEVRLFGAGGAEGAVGRGEIPRGARSVALMLAPAAAGVSAPWSAAVRASGAAGELVDRVDVPSSVGKLLGDPRLFRAEARPHAPVVPVADFTFRRTERLQAQWPVLGALDARQARLLGRAGQPIAVDASAMEVTQEGLRILTADVVLAPLAPAEYVLEVTVGAGAEREQRLLAFRVVR